MVIPVDADWITIGIYHDYEAGNKPPMRADNPLGGWHLVCCPFRNFKIFHPCVFFLTTVVYCSMSPKKRLNKGDSYKSSGKKVSASAKKKIFKVKKEPAKCWFL
ncbi:hypothetical protein PC123_g20712 [Phytophthora cactorum]|nr:hypothetical protein PC123_g20712 [Phytophthora cactorum]